MLFYTKILKEKINVIIFILPFSSKRETVLYDMVYNQQLSMMYFDL